MAFVTFIGGSFDMTRRVMEVTDRVIRMPRLREVAACFYHPSETPQFETFQVDTYVIRRGSEDHYIAFFEGLR